jgi:hypothetical protein
MNPLSALTNLITGGSNKNAEADLQQALQEIQGIQTPTSQQLQLGPLTQYNSTGQLDPALAAAAQAGPSAFNSENLSSVPNETMQKVLAQEAAIAESNGMTPQEQAQIAQAEQAVNENTAGQRGAIAQNFAGMGVPQSLISAALQNQTAGQNSQQAYQNALSGQASAANNALTAMSNEGNLSGQMFSQNAGQANTVAAAQNALNQFNAANTQQTGMANQANTQAANTYNTTNTQNLANQNVSGANSAQYQNQVEAPQQAASLALQKGQAEAGIGEAQAGQQTAVGQQNAGLVGGLLGAAGNVAGQAALGSAIAKADGGEIPPQPTVPATNFLDGGQVNGKALVPGDSKANDIVPARLSPGEVVIPRTVVAHPQMLGKFLAAKAPTMAANMKESAHPSDLASVMKALSMLRAGA